LLLESVLDGKNYNILFRARSGMGKTTLSFVCMFILGSKNCMYYLPEDGKLVPNFNYGRRIHVLDECHTLKDQEIIYPLMDCGKYTFFILTNESGELKEPIINRCIIFDFLPYSEEDIFKITKLHLEKFSLPDNLIRIISLTCTFPREIKVLCDRLTYIFERLLVPKNEEELNNILQTVIGINDAGLNRLERNYLEYLESVGGQASLNVLSYGLGIDKTSLLRDIEPSLIYKKLIKITSRGRSLCKHTTL
jgi:Holliday junction resolvasome RuvABC ATP-dependent DNA helicase subunit